MGVLIQLLVCDDSSLTDSINIFPCKVGEPKYNQNRNFAQSIEFEIINTYPFGLVMFLTSNTAAFLFLFSYDLGCFLRNFISLNH